MQAAAKTLRLVTEPPGESWKRSSRRITTAFFAPRIALPAARPMPKTCCRLFSCGSSKAERPTTFRRTPKLTFRGRRLMRRSI